MKKKKKKKNVSLKETGGIVAYSIINSVATFERKIKKVQGNVYCTACNS